MEFPCAGLAVRNSKLIYQAQQEGRIGCQGLTDPLIIRHVSTIKPLDRYRYHHGNVDCPVYRRGSLRGALGVCKGR